MSSARSNLINFAAFQAGWLACVLGAAGGYPWLGPVVAVTVLSACLAGAAGWRAECRLAGFALLFGATFDSLLLATGWLDYPNGLWVPGLAPVWILALWVLFGTTLNRSMAWLHGRPWLAAALGAVFGPLSYQAGARLGAVEILQGVPLMVALAVGWTLAMPLLLVVAHRTAGAGRPGHALQWPVTGQGA